MAMGPSFNGITAYDRIPLPCHRDGGPGSTDHLKGGCDENAAVVSDARTAVAQFAAGRGSTVCGRRILPDEAGESHRSPPAGECKRPDRARARAKAFHKHGRAVLC